MSVTKKYLCVRHYELTPSVVIYDEFAFCYGCRTRYLASELGSDYEGPQEQKPRYVEDLKASIARIRSLPLRSVRGFELPCDSGGYYLLWASLDYYKYRSTDTDAPGGKYRGPSGHKKPWFFANEGAYEQAILIEGEFNALSYALLDTPQLVISPGGAGDFYSRSAEPILADLINIAEIILVLDADKAGAQAAIECKARLLTYGSKNVKIVLVEKDFNDKLVEEGQEGLRKYCHDLGLFAGVQHA